MKTESIYKLLEDNGFKISTDSRTVTSGEVFFALRGERFNGNIYAADALDRGAVIAIIDDPDYKTGNTILVDNVESELQSVARLYRKNLDIPVLGITGSNGKTTTKELLARVLAKKFKVHYTRGNNNNHIGVPLTLLSCSSDTEFLIVEMGANHRGEIKTLSEIADPVFGLVTNIGKAHLEGFGSIEAIIDTKSELYDYIESKSGTVFFNESNEVLRSVLNKRAVEKISYQHPGNNVVEIIRLIQNPQLNIELIINKEKYHFETNLFGIHNSENVLASIAVGLYFGIPVPDIQLAVESYLPDNNRSQIFKTGKNTLVCDSYNANPVSMLKSIESFKDYPGDNKLLILGDMLELGEYEKDEHDKVLAEVSESDNIKVFVVGPVFHSLASKYNILSFPSIDQLMNYLSDKPVRDSFVLVKASRALELEKIYGLM